MIKKLISIAAIACLIILLPFAEGGNQANADTHTSINDPLKPWTITFNDKVMDDPNNLHAIYIQTADNLRHDVSIQLSADSKKVTVKPKKPYLFGTTYTLVIPKEVRSAKGSPLNKEATKIFQLTGTNIKEITAIANPLVTNIVVKGTADVTSVTYSVNGGNEQTLFRTYPHFSRGEQGLIKGDLLTIRAYDGQGGLMETQHYKVR